MVSSRAQPQDLIVDHVRKPRERMPMPNLGKGESPENPAPG